MENVYSKYAYHTLVDVYFGRFISFANHMGYWLLVSFVLWTINNEHLGGVVLRYYLPYLTYTFVWEKIKPIDHTKNKSQSNIHEETNAMKKGAFL